MKLRFDELAHQAVPPKILIQSFEGSLYRVVAEVGSKQFLIVDDSNKVVTSSHPSSLVEKLNDYLVESVVLQQFSAYDEMIGHPAEGDGVNGCSLGRLTLADNAITNQM
jgi:hypothetical protein